MERQIVQFEVKGSRYGELVTVDVLDVNISDQEELTLFGAMRKIIAVVKDKKAQLPEDIIDSVDSFRV